MVELLHSTKADIYGADGFDHLSKGQGWAWDKQKSKFKKKLILLQIHRFRGVWEWIDTDNLVCHGFFGLGGRYEVEFLPPQ